MSLATMNNLAYDTFEPGLNGQLEKDPSTYSLFKKSSRGVEGRTAKVKLLTGRSLGIGNIAEGGDYPAAGDPTSAEASITLAEVAAVLEFTTFEAALLRSKSAAAEDTVMLKMEDLKDTVKRDLIRQSTMDGTARLARCTAAAGVNVVPLASTTTNQVDRDRDLWLHPGAMLIDFVDSVTGTAIANGTGREITVFDPPYTSITVSGAANLTPTATTVIVRSGNVLGGGTYTSREFPGLLGIVEDGNTYMGINRATGTNSFWRSTVLDNAGVLRPLSTALVQQLRNRIGRQGNPPTAPDWCFMANQGVWTAYAELLTPQVRYKQMEKLDMGWPALDVFGTPFYQDIHFARSQMFGLHKPSIEWKTAKHARRNIFQFQDDDGSVFRMKPGTAAGRYAASYQAHLDGFATIVSNRPNLHGRLDDLSEVAV